MFETKWTLQKIDAYISDGIQENLHLEYKACATLLNPNRDELLTDLTKQVTAFANADGGTLLFGVREGNLKENTKHIPIGKDEGFTRGGKVSAIWLEDILLSNISPKIQGLKPYEIELENGNFLLVLEVPPSQYGPHMAKDYRYYKRRQTKVEPMEHYEVEDVRNRSRGPLLRLNVEHFPEGKILRGNVNHFFRFELENLVDKPAEYTQILFFIDSRLSRFRSDNFLKKNHPISADALHLDTSAILDSQAGYTSLLSPVEPHRQISFECFSAFYGLPKNPPAWKGNNINLGGISFEFIKDAGNHTYFYGWQVLAPYMSIQQQFYYFSVEASSTGGGHDYYDFVVKATGEVSYMR
ncbi:MAG: helix-turn-helix domain-containing protein [Candidatus Sericytochromatia bacterium]